MVLVELHVYMYVCDVQGDVRMLLEFGAAHTALSSYLETVVGYLTLR